MKVEQIMTKRVATVEMDDTLKTIDKIFQQANFHHLLVVDEGRLVGVISDRDVLAALSPFLSTMSERKQDLGTLNRKVHQIMSRHPVTVTKHILVEEAALLLIKNNISCLPITSSEGTIEGIITWKDILRWSVSLAEQLESEKD